MGPALGASRSTTKPTYYRRSSRRTRSPQSSMVGCGDMCWLRTDRLSAEDLGGIRFIGLDISEVAVQTHVVPNGAGSCPDFGPFWGPFHRPKWDIFSVLPDMDGKRCIGLFRASRLRKPEPVLPLGLPFVRTAVSADWFDWPRGPWRPGSKRGKTRRPRGAQEGNEAACRARAAARAAPPFR